MSDDNDRDWLLILLRDIVEETQARIMRTALSGRVPRSGAAPGDEKRHVALRPIIRYQGDRCDEKRKKEGT